MVFLLHISTVERECICAFSRTSTPSPRRKRAEDLLIFKERRFSEEDRLSPPETEERGRRAVLPLSPAMCLDRADSAKARLLQCSWSDIGGEEKADQAVSWSNMNLAKNGLEATDPFINFFYCHEAGGGWLACLVTDTSNSHPPLSFVHGN